MYAPSRQRILESLDDSARVLDVGAWAKPFSRADWVVDLLPYETRGLYGEPDPEPERFSAETWLNFDICARQPWPFEDKSFDFAICSHTLEDVRDPVWVCSELERVAKAGYVEVPSRLEEQSRDVHGLGWVGWSHHHWLIDVDETSMTYVFKPGLIHADPRFSFPAWFGGALLPEERVQTLFWQDRLPAAENVFTASEDLNRYLESFVTTHRHLCDGRIPRPSLGARLRGRVRRRL